MLIYLGALFTLKRAALISENYLKRLFNLLFIATLLASSLNVWAILALDGTSIIQDVSSSGNTTDAGSNTLSFTHPTTTSNSNRLLVVTIAIGDNVSNASTSIGTTEVDVVTY